MTEPRNPFVIRQLARDEHFADREDEVARMVRALRDPGAGLLVYGHRRLGKSSALERAAEVVRSRGGLAVVASLATATDAADAGRRVLEAVQRVAGRSGRETLEAIVGRLSARMEIQPSSTPGELPAIRIMFGPRDRPAEARLLPDVLTAVNAEMDRSGRTLGLGLDEFQRIHAWGGEDAEWALRDAMQRHSSLGYVLAGSQRSLIEAMVADRSRAFWKLFDLLEFGPIDDEELARWVAERAAGAGIPFEDGAARRIVALARPRTRDVVQLARETWNRALGKAHGSVASVEGALEAIAEAQSAVYHKLWMDLSATRQRVLRVVAVDPGLQLTAKETLDRFGLGPKSTAYQAAEGLASDEHLVRIPEGGYRFDDPFFRRWVQRNTLADLGLPVPALEP